jgi:hypothetical protein
MSSDRLRLSGWYSTAPHDTALKAASLFTGDWPNRSQALAKAHALLKVPQLQRPRVHADSEAASVRAEDFVA